MLLTFSLEGLEAWCRWELVVGPFPGMCHGTDYE